MCDYTTLPTKAFVFAGSQSSRTHLHGCLAISNTWYYKSAKITANGEGNGSEATNDD